MMSRTMTAARRSLGNQRRSFANFDPSAIVGGEPVQLHNLVDGKWVTSRSNMEIVDPLDGKPIFLMPDTQEDEIQPFVDSLSRVKKSGLHNPFKNPERYLHYGQVSAKAGELLARPEIEDLFTRAIMRCAPKSYKQAQGEVRVTRLFLQNFSADQVRFLARGFTVPGDRQGQETQGVRWPFGPVAVIAPFNFPLEIPVLQLMGALFMGNKPVLKGAEAVTSVMELFVRMLIDECGMDPNDMDVLNCKGPVMESLLTRAPIRMTQFTGSKHIAEHLSRVTNGKVKVEDAGLDWKILGPDVMEEEAVAWQCDQDGFGNSGQKCSAMSLLFAHENWEKAGIFERIVEYTKSRKLEDLTVAPVMTWTTEKLMAHVKNLLAIPGAKLLTGGSPLEGHSIPAKYGAIQPTAVWVPFEEAMKPENFPVVCSEVFGPVWVATTYRDSDLEGVLDAFEKMDEHLTAAIVSNDPVFVNKVLGNTVNGTTYAGIRARTTGAPQNHWFGPAGDPRGAGIGTKEAIQLVWSTHREVIRDWGPVPEGSIAALGVY